MITERGLSSENKFQLLHETTLAAPPAAKLLSLVWLLTWHTSSCTEGGPCQERELCRIVVSRNALLVELPPPPPSLLLFPASIHSGGTETGFFFSFILLVFHTYKQLLWQDNVYQSLL